MALGDKTKEFEGWSAVIYRDSVGKRTIGYGFNLDDPAIAKDIPGDIEAGNRPITKEEAEPIFQRLYANARKDAIRYLGEVEFNTSLVQIQETLTDMAYNLGLTRLSGFKKFKIALLNRNYSKAAEELKDSRWFDQVARRSRHHYDIFNTANKGG